MTQVIDSSSEVMRICSIPLIQLVNRNEHQKLTALVAYPWRCILDPFVSTLLESPTVCANCLLFHLVPSIELQTADFIIMIYNTSVLALFAHGKCSTRASNLRPGGEVES